MEEFSKKLVDQWKDIIESIELDSIFEGVFRDGSGQLPNSKVDYKQNQGYRFIVQFYPAGFLIEKTQSQLDRLGLG